MFSLVIELGKLALHAGHCCVLEVDRLEIPSREIVAIMGRNGAGKTTLLRTVLGFITPERGEVHVLGSGVSGLRGADLARSQGNRHICCAGLPRIGSHSTRVPACHAAGPWTRACVRFSGKCVHDRAGFSSFTFCRCDHFQGELAPFPFLKAAKKRESHLRRNSGQNRDFTEV